MLIPKLAELGVIIALAKGSLMAFLACVPFSERLTHFRSNGAVPRFRWALHLPQTQRHIWPELRSTVCRC
jgi:hypothetical protein